MTTFGLFAVSWAMLAVIILGLALFRALLAMKEDDSIHLSDAEASMAHDQLVLQGRLEKIDRWGKGLTIFALIYGLTIAGTAIWVVWNNETAKLLNY